MIGLIFAAAFTILAAVSLAMTFVVICAAALEGWIERSDRRANPFRRTDRNGHCSAGLMEVSGKRAWICAAARKRRANP